MEIEGDERGCRERECVMERERERQISLVQTVRPERFGKNCLLFCLSSVYLLCSKLVPELLLGATLPPLVSTEHGRHPNLKATFLP